jgi:pyruvate ferredoxin oxidoreductase beta subunit
MIAFELGQLAVNTGIWPLYEVECGKLRLYGKTEQIAKRRFQRLPVRDYLLKQGRFAHFSDEDIEFFQHKVDEMWDRWLIPGVIPLDKETAVPSTRAS